VAGHGGATTVTARGEARRLDGRRRHRAESVGQAVGAGGVRGRRGAGEGWAARGGRAWGGRRSWAAVGAAARGGRRSRAGVRQAAVGAAAPGGLKIGAERREREKRARRAVKLHSLPSARDPALDKDFFKI
jgi:hypothetical protein